MKLIPLAIFLSFAMSVLCAAAEAPVIYGDRKYCASYQTDPRLSDTGKPSVFDGKTIGGQDWECDLEGRCEAEGRSYTLHRCNR